MDEIALEFWIGAVAYVWIMMLILPRRNKAAVTHQAQQGTGEPDVSVTLAEMTLDGRPILLFYAVNTGTASAQLDSATLYSHSRAVLRIVEPHGPLSFPYELKPGQKVHGHVSATSMLEQFDPARTQTALSVTIRDTRGRAFISRTIGCNVERWRELAPA